MPAIMAIHQVRPHMELEDAARLVYAVLVHEGPGITWQKYWMCDETGQMVCLWTAPDTDSVWQLLRSAGVPTSDVFAVDEGDPALLRDGLEK